MSANLVAKLQLDIAGLQVALAKSDGELARWKAKSVRHVDEVSAAQKRLNQALNNSGIAVPKVNPWTTATVGSQKYLEKLQAVAKEQRLLEQHKIYAAAKAGPSTANPWASGAPAYQQQLAAKEALRMQQKQAEEAERQGATRLAMQQRLDQAAATAHQKAMTQAAAEAAALQKKHAFEAETRRHTNVTTMDARLQRQLLDARLDGNTKEVAQLERRMHLLQQMRQIQLQTGVSQREAYHYSQQLGTSTMTGKGSGAAKFAVGNAAMQAQDIAVQLQMGTSAAVVLGQQGSQLLSAFGAGGAIAGGVIAIGAAFLTMGEKAREAFKEANEAQKDFEEKGREALANGSVASLMHFTKDATQRVKELQRQVAEAWLDRSAMDVLSEWAGGPSFQSKNAANEDALKKSLAIQAQSTQAMLAYSERERDLAIAKADGQDKEAKQMERKIRLAREFLAIGQLDVPTEVRTQLENNVTDKIHAEEQQDQRSERDDVIKGKQDDAEKEVSLLQRIADIKKQAAEDGLSVQDKVLAKQQEIKEVQEEEEAMELDGEYGAAMKLEVELKRVTMQRELNQLLEEQTRVIHEASKEIDREVDAERKLVAEATKLARERKNQIQIDRKVSDHELEKLRLQARGQDKKAEKLEHKKRVDDLYVQYGDAGFSPKEAKRRAEEHTMREEQLERRRNGQPGHIYGRRGPGQKMGSAGGSGIDEFKRMQKRGYSNPLEVRGQRFHYFGNEGGSLADRATRAAGAQDERGSRDTTAMDLGKQILATVKQGLGLN